MNKGVSVVICIIATVLIMIAERGVPVKLTKWDYLVYVLLYCFLVSMVGAW